MKALAHLVVLVSFLFFINGCKNSSTNPKDTQNFTIQFARNYIQEGGWAVLHNIDGTEIIKAVQVTGNDLVDFGEIDTSHISCTIIYKFHSGNRKYTRIHSYINIAPGNWVFNGYGNSYQDLALIKLNYNPGLYDKWVVSGPQTWVSGGMPPTEANLPVFTLDSKGLFSSFAAVYESNNTNGLCGWILNQPYIEGDTNSYNITLDSQMDCKTISTTKPIDELSIESLKENYDNRYTQFIWRDNSQTSVLAHYSSNFPSDKFVILASNTENNIHYQLIQMQNTIPELLNIPDYSINGHYNDIFDQIENINITGNADRIAGNWYFRDDSISFLWDVKVPSNNQIIQKPFLSQDIVESLEFDLAQLEINQLSMYDYDTITNFDEYSKKFLSDNDSNLDDYNIYYRYAIWLN